jgi:hypothetical protein
MNAWSGGRVDNVVVSNYKGSEKLFISLLAK